MVVPSSLEIVVRATRKPHTDPNEGSNIEKSIYYSTLKSTFHIDLLAAAVFLF